LKKRTFFIMCVGVLLLLFITSCAKEKSGWAGTIDVKRRDTLRENRRILLRVRFRKKCTFLYDHCWDIFQGFKIPTMQMAIKRHGILRMDRRTVLRTWAKDMARIKMRSWIRGRLRALFFREKEKTVFSRPKTGGLIVVEARKGISKGGIMWHPLLLKKDYHNKRRYGCHSQSFRLTMLILS